MKTERDKMMKRTGSGPSKRRQPDFQEETDLEEKASRSEGDKRAWRGRKTTKRQKKENLQKLLGEQKLVLLLEKSKKNNGELMAFQAMEKIEGKHIGATHAPREGY